MDINFALLLVAIVIGLVACFFAWRAAVANKALPLQLERAQEERHRAMLTDLAEGLAKQRDRINQGQDDAAERLRTAVSQELSLTREAVSKLQLEQTQRLAANQEVFVRELLALTQLLGQKQDELKAEMLSKTLEKLNEQSRAQQEATALGLQRAMAQVSERIDLMTQTNDKRLAEISGKVNERLDEGFKKTNETFVNVIARLATIDEAQKKIDGLTTNVVSLQQLLGDKRSRGAFGEVQLEGIITNMLPPNVYEFQYVFEKNGKRADCVLKLPAPTGLIAIDSKFPLENFERMLVDEASAAQFKADVRKHIDDIADKYIIPGVTGDGAVMFLPAEAVFAEIHAHHRDLIDFAARRHVWIVSPTTMMAVLNTALAVLKDVETRKQVHVIKDALGKLGADFGRFQSRMDDLAKHIGQVSKDVELVHTSSRKITDQFQRIEKVELEPVAAQIELPVEPATAPILSVVKTESPS